MVIGGAEHPVLLRYRVPSGATLVALGTTNAGEPDTVWIDDAFVQPAGAPSALAWRLRPQPWDPPIADPSYQPVQGPEVGLAGPATAARAQLVDSRGTVVASVQLTGGLGRVSAPAAARARFLDAAGETVATVDVRRFTAAEWFVFSNQGPKPIPIG